MLPSEQTSYRYSGSLTTPPCSENVVWIIMRSKVEASQAQIDAFKSIISKDNRPLQMLHGRKVTVGN